MAVRLGHSSRLLQCCRLLEIPGVRAGDESGIGVATLLAHRHELEPSHRRTGELGIHPLMPPLEDVEAVCRPLLPHPTVDLVHLEIVEIEPPRRAVMGESRSVEGYLRGKPSAAVDRTSHVVGRGPDQEREDSAPRESGRVDAFRVDRVTLMGLGPQRVESPDIRFLGAVAPRVVRADDDPAQLLSSRAEDLGRERSALAGVEDQQGRVLPLRIPGRGKVQRIGLGGIRQTGDVLRQCPLAGDELLGGARQGGECHEAGGQNTPEHGSTLTAASRPRGDTPVNSPGLAIGARTERKRAPRGSGALGAFELVGSSGLEPLTSTMSTWRSNQLS